MNNMHGTCYGQIDSKTNKLEKLVSKTKYRTMSVNLHPACSNTLTEMHQFTWTAEFMKQVLPRLPRPQRPGSAVLR